MNDILGHSCSAFSWWSAVQLIVAGESIYSKLCILDRMDRIRLVKHGIPARLLPAVAVDMNVPREKLYGWLGIPRTTANRKVKIGDVLNRDESERVLGIACLIGKIQLLVVGSDESEGFDAARWAAAWLQEENYILGGVAPSAFMDTADGRALVHSLVEQMHSGAYA